MDELHTYIYHIWNEWARGFVPEAVTPWFVREDWLKEDPEIFKEFIQRIGCERCEYFFEDHCGMTDKNEFEMVEVPCKDPNI